MVEKESSDKLLQPLTAEEQEELAVSFFEFIGHPEFAELPMTYVKDGEAITIPEGKHFWSYCGHIVGPMTDTVKAMDDSNPQKARYISALEATALMWAGNEPSSQQTALNEQ